MTVANAPPVTDCPACGAELTGRYCASCGQRSGLRVLSVRALLREVVEDQFSVNATLPRTLRALFFRPGFLTTEYLHQRISLYVPPFRLYLVASVVFFVVASFQARSVEFNAEDRVEFEQQRAALQDSMAARRARGETEPLPRFGLHVNPLERNWADSAVIELGNDRLNRAVRARLKMLEALPPDEGLRRMFGGLLATAPKVMFLLLPLYALLLKLLYSGKKRYYVEHFIFSLHVHAFTFALFTLLMLLPEPPAAAGFLMLWLMVYTWLAVKRVYRQGWMMTTLKWLVLGNVYVIAVVCGVALALLAAFFSI
jgi:hypothetical protein